MLRKKTGVHMTHHAVVVDRGSYFIEKKILACMGSGYKCRNKCFKC